MVSRRIGVLFGRETVAKTHSRLLTPYLLVFLVGVHDGHGEPVD